MPDLQGVGGTKMKT